MPTDNESTKWLYKQLSDRGYNVGKDLSEFDNLMRTNKESREWAFQTARSNGLNVGKDQSEFDSLVAPIATGQSTTSTQAGIAAQQVVDEYDRSVAENGNNTPLSTSQQERQPVQSQIQESTPRAQFVPEYANVKGFTVAKDSPLRQQYPFLDQLGEDEQAYFRIDTNEPLYAWKDSKGKDITPDEAATLNQRADIEQNDAIRPRQVPVASLQLPEEVKSSGIRTDKKMTEYIDGRLKEQYGDDYLDRQITLNDGTTVSGDEMLGKVSQQVYDNLNKQINEARVTYVSADDAGRERIINQFVDNYKGLLSEATVKRALEEQDALQGATAESKRRERAEWTQMKEDNPSFWQTLRNSVSAGFINFGAGLLDTMQELSSGLIVEDPSKPGGYMRTRSYEESLADKNDPMTIATNMLHGKAEQLSKSAQPYKGKKGFLDMLWDGEITEFLQKGVATAGESLPMTLSAFNPYTMAINAISMAGSNFRQNTLDNPNIPAWKRAMQAIGSAAIEQAVEKYSDPIFKYVGGNKVLRSASKENSEKIVNDITTEAVNTLSDRIFNRLKGLVKDAAGEGAEEVMADVGNDLLGETLDLVSGSTDYGLRAQWEEFKEDNPNADLKTFAKNKAKEYVEDFIGGAMAGAYTSGTAQLSTKALQYSFDKIGGTQNQVDSTRLNPVQVDIAQAYDDGYNAEEGETDSMANDYMQQRLKVENMFNKEQLQEIDDNFVAVLDRYPDASDDLKQTIIDYVNAKARYEGMMQRNSDDAETGIDHRNLHSDGMIHAAVLYPSAESGGQPQEVFIIKGDIVADVSGKVDVEKSSDMITYRGADGLPHIASPDKFQSVAQPISVEEYVAANAPQEVQARYAPGQQVSVNIDGQDIEGEVTNVGEDGNVLVSFENPDGTLSSRWFAPEELQQSDGGIAEGQEEIQDEQAPFTDGNVQLSTVDNVQQKQPAQTEQPIQEAAQQTSQAEQASQPQQTVLPKDKDGNLIYDRAPVEATIADLYDGNFNDEEVQGFIDANITDAQKKYDSVQKKTPKIGTNKAKYLEQKRKWQADVDEAKRVLDYWNEVNNQKQRLTHTTPQEVEAAQAELSGQNAREEFRQYNENAVRDAVSVASDFIRGAKITPESFRAETGYGTGEQRRFVGMIATEQNGGKSIDRLAEELVSYDNAELNGVTFNGDTGVAKDAILEALQSAGTRGELATDNTAEQERYVEARRAELDAQYMEAYGMTYENYLAYEEQNLPNMLRKYANFDEVEFYNLYAEEIEQSLNARINEQGNDTAGEEPRTGGGNEVLPGERTDNVRGSEGGTEQGTEVPTGVQGTVEDGTVPEKAQQLEPEPIGTNRFGNIYNWVKGQFQSAASFLNNLKSGYLRGVFYRDGIGNIDMVWGNEKAGLQHIINKHIEEADDFNSVEEAMQVINETINNGTISQQGTNISLDYNGYRVSIAQSNEGNWVLTAFDKTRSRAEKQRNKGNATIGDQSVSDMENGTLVSPQLASSESKDTQTSANEQTVGEKIAQEEAKVEQNPTEAQKEAGNYKKGHVKIDGYDVTIENPKGSVRKGTDRNGQEWSVTMNNTYGYIRGTKGVDGDHIDVFLSDDPTQGDVYVIDQVNEDGSFDEHKVMYGFNSAEEARDAYLANYSPGWQGLGTITKVSKDEFKKWIDSSHRKTKPFAEYKNVKKDGAQNEGNGTDAQENDIKEKSEKVWQVASYLNNRYGYNFYDTLSFVEWITKKKNYRSWLEDRLPPYQIREVIKRINEYVEAQNKMTRRDNGGVRYRFIGEQGAARLDAAEEATTRLDNLDTARRMEQAYNDKKARIEKLRDSKPVEITGEEIEPSDDLKQYKKNALEYGKKLQGNYVNKDTGITIQLQRGRRNGGINEVLQHDYKDVEHLQSVAAIPQIIENSIYIDSRENTDKEKNPNVAEYQYYVCGLKIGNTDYTVRSTIAVDNKGNRYYDHKLTSIEKGKLLDQINDQAAKNIGFGTTPGTKPTTENGFTPTGDAPIPSYTKSKDTRLVSLLQTNDQENARKIKLATGWERGADGKWRYETPDFEYNPPKKIEENKEYKLRDFIKDDELFKAYPELEKIKVFFNYVPEFNYGGAYYPRKNEIIINTAHNRPSHYKSTFVHEIQHSIQRIERFAFGGTGDAAMDIVMKNGYYL